MQFSAERYLGTLIIESSMKFYLSHLCRIEKVEKPRHHCFISNVLGDHHQKSENPCYSHHHADRKSNKEIFLFAAILCSGPNLWKQLQRQTVSLRWSWEVDQNLQTTYNFFPANYFGHDSNEANHIKYGKDPNREQETKIKGLVVQPTHAPGTIAWLKERVICNLNNSL